MPVSAWVVSAKVIVSAEAIAGILLTISLLVFLCRKDIGRAARMYRISCMITALLGFYTSFLLLLLQDVVILVDDCLAVVLYGRLLFYLPNRVIDHLAVAFFTQVHTMWQTISAPSIVQWMTLAKPNSSSARKLIYAYSIPALFYANTWYYMYYIIPDRSLKTTLVNSIFKLHGTDLNDFHIYGFRMIDDVKDGDLRDIMLYEAFPSYIASYGLFILSALQIRIRLRRFGNVSSTRTSLMQRRFFRIQIAQVLLPLVLLSPPFCIALIAAMNGVSFANLSFILVYTLWLSPSATAFLLLIFVAKSDRGGSHKTSISKILPNPQAASMSSRGF